MAGQAIRAMTISDGETDTLYDIDGFWFGDRAEWFDANGFDSIA
jgi:hypothetical protein